MSTRLQQPEETEKVPEPQEKSLFSFVGKSHILTEAPLVISGKAVYPSDIELPNMLHGKILRSPHAHAKIIEIYTSEAEKIEGVKAIITGKELPDVRYGSALKERYVLARDVVRFVGEPVAAVAAKSVEIAERAILAIKVKYEVLPAVFDAEEALDPAARVIVHPDIANYSAKSSALVYSARIPKGLPNCTNSFSVKRGDIERGYRESDLIVENRFSTGFAQHCPLEPHASVAEANPDGSLCVWTGCAIPFRIVQQVSETLQIPQAKVRVIQPMVGGSYGAKNNMEVEPIAGALSLRTQRPVKIVLTRKEEFLTVVRHPFIVYVKDGVRKKDGRILSRTVKCVLNGGAYSGGSGNAVARNCAFGITDSYKIENLSVDTYRAYTNLPPAGAFRGFGTPQVLWAIEQQMDTIAYRLGIDPVKIREVNLLEDGDTTALGELVHNLPIKECLAKAADAINWREPPKRRGDWSIARGLAVGSKYSQAPTTSIASVKLYSDGSLNVIVTTVDSGQGIRTALATIAAEEMQVPMEKVQVTFPDTSYTPYDDGNISSRGTFNVGNAIRLACEDLRKRMYRAAAGLLGESQEDLYLSEGVIVSRRSGRSVKYSELFSSRISSVPMMVGDEGEFIGRGLWTVRTSKMDPNTSQPVDLKPGQEVRICSFYTPVAQAAEVAVNVRTGEIKLLKVVTVADAGRAINRSAVESQLNGAAIMGLGLVLSEEMNFENGRLLNSGFLDYRLLTTMDTPETFEAHILESDQIDGPFGAKGAGEVGIIAIGAAVGNAIHNATGIRFYKAPITPKAILDAILEKKKEETILPSVAVATAKTK